MYSQFSFVVSTLTFITMVLGNAPVGTAVARSIAAGLAAYLLFVVGDLAVNSVLHKSDDLKPDRRKEAPVSDEQKAESRGRNDSGEALAA